MSAHPRTLSLEELAFADRGDRELRRHVSECATCTDAVRALREARSEFLAVNPPEPFLAEVARRGRARTRRWVTGLALAASILIAAFAGVRITGGRGADAESAAITLRGSAAAPRLSLFVSEGGAPAVPYDGGPLRAGDALRFSLAASRPGYAFIANIDAAGRTTRYFPTEGQAATWIDAGNSLLPGSIVLDEVLGPERVVLVFSNQPLDEARIFRALEKSYAETRGDLDQLRLSELPAEVAVVKLRKVPK